MEYLEVIGAGVAAYAFGAVWYSVLSGPWMAASGVAVGPDGRPANAKDPVPYVVALVAAVAMAGMLRLVLDRAGVADVWGGLRWGVAAGLFLGVPWLATCYGFAGRPRRLILIDGAYATLGAGIAGAVLGAF